MRTRSDSVSIHPYFKVHAGKMDAIKALFPQFVAKTTAEPGCLYYGFSVSGDIVHCREAYADAAALLAHVQSVGGLIAEVLKIADIDRLEVHGPAGELDKLRGPLSDLKPVWFVYETGLVS